MKKYAEMIRNMQRQSDTVCEELCRDEKKYAETVRYVKKYAEMSEKKYAETGRDDKKYADSAEMRRIMQRQSDM